MIEIRNKTAGPVQLIVRSFSDRREHAKALTRLNIPGHKKIHLADERIVPEYLERCKRWGLLSARTINNEEVHD